MDWCLIGSHIATKIWHIFLESALKVEKKSFVNKSGQITYDVWQWASTDTLLKV